NRDWIALTQPEILNQVKVLREWFPLVYVDLHEMGADSTYFFSPESDPYHAGERDYPAGTYVVPMAQPSKRLIRTLLDPQTSMDDKFIAAEEARRKLKERTEIYDVTAWSLPLLFNVEAVANNAVSQGNFEMAKPGRVLPGEVHAANAAVAFLAPWGSEAAGRLLTAALRQD